MTTPRKPRRNKGGGKLHQERAKAGVEAPVQGAPVGIHALDPEEGELFQHDPADICPNPMNQRLGMGNLDELVDSVRRQGVHTPGAVMHTDLFMEMYPEWAEQVAHPERTYILGPGHRRREASLKAGKPMLVILRDKWAKERTVEENLISENKDRENLTPIEQALQLDLLRRRGMTGEEIAERAGYSNRGSVSRILNLLDLPQEIQASIHAGKTSQKAGYTLSTIKDEQGRNSSEAAQALQMKAFGWMQAEGVTAEVAKNRLTIEAAVFPAGNTQPNDGPPAAGELEAVGQSEDVSRGKQSQEIEGTEKPETSQQTDPAIPHQSTGEQPAGTSSSGDGAPEESAEDKSRRLAAAAAAKQRDLACRLILAEERYAGAAEVSTHLVNAVLNPKEWKQAAALAHKWLSELGKGPTTGRPTAYFDAIASSTDANLRRRAAFAVALAADELRVSLPDREWDARDRAHIEFLITSKAGYQPTEYEQELLGLSAPQAK
ncbi:ParB/RepB/Spo0J family partition protein [Streptomyces sp. NPDC015232]|uniref:ParB/RepB/Spo0J family partition protein n=1 Tax=unclassified Streptomyces TaxID=2593676 RepID=UPI0037023BEA